MRELAEHLLRWQAAGSTYTLATVIGVGGSAPRPVGATMAVDENGSVRGSLSGGCVEGDVYEICREVLDSGTPVRRTFGFSDADAFAVGLTCGGELEVFVQRITPAEYPAVAKAVTAAEPVSLVRDLATGAMLVLEQDEAAPNEGPAWAGPVVPHARAMLDAGTTGLCVVGCAEDERTVFVESFTTPPRMIVFGTTDFTIALCRVGRMLGYHVTVCEPRPVFAEPARVPEAHDVVVEWPHRYLANTEVDSRTVVCVLTHDPKFDIPVLTTALRLPIAYVGAMGSRRADRQRRTELREAGVSDTDLRRLHSPVGLELGGRTPEETAIAVGAEIIAVRTGGTARPLSKTERPIHAGRQHDRNMLSS